MRERPPLGIRSISLYKSLYKNLGPFRRELTSVLEEKQIYDPQGLLLEEETPQGKSLFQRKGGLISCIIRQDSQGENLEEETWEYDDRGNLLRRSIHKKDQEKPEIIDINHEQDGLLVLEKQGNRIRAVLRNRDGLIQKELLYTGEAPDAVIKYRYDEYNRLIEICKKEPNGRIRTMEERAYTPSGRLASMILKDSRGGILQELCYDYPAGDDLHWLICRVWAPQSGFLQKKRMLYKLTRELNFYPGEESPLPLMTPPPTVPAAKESPPSIEPEEMIYKNGTYRGELKEGKMSGKGIFLFNDGSRYEGEFLLGFMSGRGKLEFSDGRIYEGDFVQNRMEGQGSCTWPEGDHYTGSFENNMMHGPGHFYWAGGNSFKGLFENNRRTEQGVFLEKGED